MITYMEMVQLTLPKLNVFFTVENFLHSNQSRNLKLVKKEKCIVLFIPKKILFIMFKLTKKMSNLNLVMAIKLINLDSKVINVVNSGFSTHLKKWI